MGFFFSDLGLGERKKLKKKNSENDQLTGHFQRVFLSSEKIAKTRKVNQQSVLNLSIFHHFPKNLDRTITFNSVTLKNKQTEPQKKIFFDETNNI